jgi:hypothetical protein
VTPARIRRSFALLALASILSAAVAAGTGAVALAGTGGPSGSRHVGHAKPGGGVAQLLDHGGPVLLHANVVEIFWGPTGDFDPQLRPAMEQLLGGMNGSAYLAVAQQYMRVATTISSSLGTSLTDTSAPPKKGLQPNDLGNEVAKLVANPEGGTIYFVFTSNLPHINYCAYHSTATADGVLVQVAYVPLQPAGCSPLGSVNLHANSYDESVQASADSAAHEFMEAVTDPHLDAWYDRNGAEIADKCEYDYQGVVHLSNHSDWQIQSEWSNALQACDPGLGR